MRILIGSGNPGKSDEVRRFLQERGFETASGVDFPIDPEETGRTPAENAAIKAKAYCEASGLPTLSFDSGLYMLSLPPDDPRQPGLYVRRAKGRRMDDQEMLDYYIALAHELGGKVLCQWVTGFGAAMPDGRVVSGDDSEGQPLAWQFYLTDKPCGEPPVGKPLHCISVEADSGRYFSQREIDGSSAERGRCIRERALAALLGMAEEGGQSDE